MANLSVDTISLRSESLSPKTRKQFSITRFRWSSHWEYIIFSLSCTVSIFNFCALTSGGSETDANILQFILAYILIGLPLYYMQVVIGQYTQMGIIFFKYLCPIGHGVSYSFVMTLLVFSVERGLIVADLLVYFLTSMQSQLQWMRCPTNNTRECWTDDEAHKNCTEQCLKGAHLSAKYFYFQKYLEYSSWDLKEAKFELAPTKKIIPVFASWFVTVIFLIYSIANYKKVIKLLLLLSLKFFLLVIIGCMMSNGLAFCIAQFSKIHPKSWTHASAWTAAISTSIRVLSIGRGFHILNGSFMAPTTSSGILSVAAVMINFLLTVVGAIITYLCYGIVIYTSKTSTKYVKLEHGDMVYMVIIPQALGFMAVSQFWSVIYFAGCTSLVLSNQVTHVMTMEKVLSDAFPSLLRYRKYVLSVICLFGFISGMFLVSKGALVILEDLVESIHQTAILNSTLMCILVCWVYGVQRLCDDIHFLSGSQPTIFWKICWYFLPLVTIITHLLSTYVNKKNHISHNYLVFYMFFLLWISPIPIVAIYETFRFMKMRNLFGLFHPDDRFGPPSENDRYLRQVFNPRKEIRCRRRNDECSHKCLVGNKILQRIVEEESKTPDSESVIIDEETKEQTHTEQQ